MIIRKTMHPDWLSNTWLVADEPGGHGVVIDTGGPAEPILEHIRTLDLTLTHVLCTHHHYDHVEHNGLYVREFSVPVCGHGDERALFGGLDQALASGETVTSGSLQLVALHIPGHTCGQLAFVVDQQAVFTGDTLFRGSVGGTRAPGHTTFADLRRSIMDVLMALPREMTVHPGHTEATSVGHEWEHNPFIRAWRGLDEIQPKPCMALGEAATLLLRAPDYDGGTKCWVRFDDTGREDVVAGSRVDDRG